MEPNSELTWKAVSLVGGTLAGVVARQVMMTTWRAVARREPPENPADRRVSWAEAIIWAAAVGVGAGVARMVATRSAAAVWEAATDAPPPGVQRD